MVSVWLVAAYTISFVGTILITYMVAVCFQDVDRVPLLCEAGGENPAYSVFSVGMTLSSIIYMLIVWALYRDMALLKLTNTANILNVIALALGFAAGLGLIFMATLSIRGRYRARHNDAARIYLFASLGHAALITAMTILLPFSMLIREWRTAVTAVAGICVIGMWIARRVYIQALRRQQPIYKNLFDGQPVSRVITSEGDLMGELEFGQDSGPMSEPINDEPSIDDSVVRTTNFIKRFWAVLQYTAVGCLLLFQISFVYE
uniref:CWH43-like N-terminal domain-containing protein n=1 Tax=Lotharella globosa TaxID=91324 RepID=A0A7S4DVZ8_9EUKA